MTTNQYSNYTTQNLVGLVKNAVRSVALVGAMAVGLYGCHPDPIEPDNVAPVASLILDKYSGQIPLEVNISGVAHDADGDVDITNYKIVINNKSTSSIDTTINSFDAIPSFKRVFKTVGVYDVTFTATDSHGAHDSKSVAVTVSDKPPVPSTYSINFLSSTSGDSPLNLPLKVSGISGTDHVVGYRLHVDDKVSSVKHSPSIDTTLVLYAGTHTVYAEAITSGAPVSSSSYNIVVNWVNGPNREWAFSPLIPLPKGPLNFFISHDNTAAALAYNAATSRAQRDDLIASRVDGNWLSHFAPSVQPPFTCSNYMIGAVVNSIASLDTNLYYNGDFKLFDWNSDDDPYLTRLHGGNFSKAGDMGLPMLELVLTDMSENHGMNAIFSGDDLSAESVNNIEFEYDATNVKSGEYYLEKNCTATYLHPYSYTSNANGVNKNNLTELPVMIINYVNGTATNVRYNPNVEMVKTRNGK